MPHFRYGKNGSGGVGQGEGEVGTPIGQRRAAGQRHKARPAAIRAPTSWKSTSRSKNWPQILGDELELPRIEPKGKANITQEKARYTSIRRTGPESLRHFKRTYMQALRRQISSNSTMPHDPRDRADPRGQALSLLDHDPAAASQRGR